MTGRSKRTLATEERTKRDLERLRRHRSERGFFRSLALIGSVGWPIVLLSIGGAMAGRYLDQHWGTRLGFTLGLLVLGTLAGCTLAYRTLRGDQP